MSTDPTTAVRTSALLAGALGEPQRQPSSVGWWWWVAVCWTPGGMKRIANRVDVIERDGALWVGSEDCRDSGKTYERAALKAGWWFAEAVERSAAPANSVLSNADGQNEPK